MANIYMPYLFTNELFESFRPEVKDTFKEFNIVYGQNIISFDEEKLVLRNKKSISRGNSSNFNKFFDVITKTCIGKDGRGVSKSYAVSAIKKATKKALAQNSEMHDAVGVMNKHDIAFIARKKGVNLRSEIDNDNIFLDDIQGFILTQIGECSLHPEIPALKIICSGNSKVSKYLMYIYIKSLQHLNHDIGLLELAGSYKNAAGFCLYNKFGFREDSMLDHNDCFHEGVTGGTLAMKVDLTDTGLINDLDDVLVGKKNMVELETTTQTSEPMCDKDRDIGNAGSHEQNEYINIRTNNRKYLKDLFDRYDEDEIKELLTENDIDVDILEGDGVSDINYALKELIEKGKIKAVDYNEELNEKKKKRKRSFSSSTSNSSSSENKHIFNKKYKAKTMKYKAKKKKYKAKTLKYKAKTKTKPMKYKATLKKKKGLSLSSSSSSSSSSI